MSTYDAATTEALERLVHAVELAAESREFTLYFVECGLQSQQDEHIAYLGREWAAYGVTPVTLDVRDRVVEDLHQAALDCVHQRFPDGAPDRLALAVVGLEASILLDSDEQHPGVLQVLNLAREKYPRTLPYPFTIWLSNAMLRRVQSAAPDFWSWRSAEPERLAISHELLAEEVRDALASTRIEGWSDAVARVGRLEYLFSACRETHMDADSQVELLSGLGDAYRFLERYEKARRAYLEALDSAERRGRSEARARLLNKLGIVMRETGDPDQARLFFHQYLEETREDQNSHAAALNNLGLVYLDGDETHQAVEVLEQARGIAEQGHNREALSNALGNLGLAYLKLDQVDHAIEYLHRSLDISQRLEDQRGHWRDLMNLGLAYSKAGDLERAVDFYQRGAEVSEKAGDLIEAKRCLVQLARCLVEAGRKSASVSVSFSTPYSATPTVTLAGPCAAHMKVSDVSTTGFTLTHAGPLDHEWDYEWAVDEDALKLGLGQLGRMQVGSTPRVTSTPTQLDPVPHYERALDIARRIKDGLDEFDILAALASLYQERGEDSQRLVTRWEEALQKAQALGDPHRELYCLASLIRLHGRGEPDATARLKQQARLLLQRAGRLRSATLNVWLCDERGHLPARGRHTARVGGQGRFLGAATQLMLRTGDPYVLCVAVGDLTDWYGGASYDRAPASLPLEQSEILVDLALATDLSTLESRRAGRDGIARFADVTPAVRTRRDAPVAEERTTAAVETPAMGAERAGAEPRHEPASEEPSAAHHEESVRREVRAAGAEAEAVVELEVAVEGLGFEAETREGRLVASLGESSDILFIPVTPARAGNVRFNVRCEGNGIPFDATLSVMADAEGHVAEWVPGPNVMFGEFPIQYGGLLRASERQVRASLQIDRVAGTSPVALEANTSEGVLHIEDVLREVGIELEVVWRHELPPEVMGPEGAFSDRELMAALERYRDEPPAGLWSFYLVYGGRFVQSGVESITFGQRQGAAVFATPGAPPHDAMWTVLHEIGHLLNLPHPWDLYGDTRSVMSFPHRWEDWSWEDPSVYRFDQFGVQHILHAPEKYVRPGCSAFLDYGRPAPSLHNKGAVIGSDAASGRAEHIHGEGTVRKSRRGTRTSAS